MAKRGPKPKPSAVKKAMGNPGKRPISDWVEAPARKGGKALAAPKELDAIASAEWKRLAPSLTLRGILTDWDRSIFTSYCQAWSTYSRSQTELNKLAKDPKTFGGLVLTTGAGNQIQHPLVGIRNTAQRDMLRFATELGLTPVARVRVGDAAPDTAAAAARAGKPAEAGKGESYFAD